MDRGSVIELYSSGSGIPSPFASSIAVRQYLRVTSDALASASDTVTYTDSGISGCTIFPAAFWKPSGVSI